MVGRAELYHRNEIHSQVSIRDHRDLVVDLVIELYLGLRIVFAVFFQEFYLEAIDPTVVVHVFEESFYSIGQGNADRGRDRPGIGRENAERDGFRVEVNAGTGLDAARARSRVIAGTAGKD